MTRSWIAAAGALGLAACTSTPLPPAPWTATPASPTCAELYQQRVAPEFPAAAKKAGESGYVIATFALDGSGRAGQIQIVESRPAGLFDEAAIDALQASEFKKGARVASCRYVADFGSGRKP
jgi:periplasmic protein TonB